MRMPREEAGRQADEDLREEDAEEDLEPGLQDNEEEEEAEEGELERRASYEELEARNKELERDNKLLEQVLGRQGHRMGLEREVQGLYDSGYYPEEREPAGRGAGRRQTRGVGDSELEGSEDDDVIVGGLSRWVHAGDLAGAARSIRAAVRQEIAGAVRGLATHSRRLQSAEELFLEERPEFKEGRHRKLLRGQLALVREKYPQLPLERQYELAGRAAEELAGEFNEEVVEERQGADAEGRRLHSAGPRGARTAGRRRQARSPQEIVQQESARSLDSMRQAHERTVSPQKTS